MSNDSDQKTCPQSEDKKCVWWINSPEHNNCLKVYIKAKSNPDGSMPELVQTDIARLLGWSNTKTHFRIRQAVEELVEALTKNQANQLLENSPDEIVNIPSSGMGSSGYSGDDSNE